MWAIVLLHSSIVKLSGVLLNLTIVIIELDHRFIEVVYHLLNASIVLWTLFIVLLNLPIVYTELGYHFIECIH